MRDDLPRLLAPPILPNGLPNPRIWRRPPTWRGRGRRRPSGEGERGRRSALAGLLPRSRPPSPLSGSRPWSPASTVGGGTYAQSRPRRWPKPRAPASTGGSMPSMASGGGYSGPLVYRNGEGMRPDVAAAFDRMAAAAAARRAHPGRQFRLPLRRRTGGALRRPSRPDVGGAAGPLAAPLRDRARPRAGIRLRLAGRQRHPLRLRPALLVGGLALRLRPAAGALLGGGQRGRRDGAAGDGGDGALAGPPACRPSSRPASGRRCCAPPPTGTSPPPCSPRS